MRRPVTLLASICGAMLVTGSACSSGDDLGPNYSSVSTTPTTSSSPTPTESLAPTDVPTTGPNVNPGELAPMEPPGAQADTAEGAQSFAAYYFKMLDWSYAVNSADLMDPLYAATCDNCRKLTQNLETTFARGTVTGARVVIKQIALVTNDGRGGAQFAVDGVVDISAGQLTEANGTAPIPAEPNVTVTLWVVHTSGHWRVVSQAQA